MKNWKEWCLFALASAVGGGLVANWAGWKTTFVLAHWWEITAAIATSAAVVVSLVLARRSETRADNQEKKYGELLARRIYHDLEVLRQALISLEPALGAVDSGPAAVLSADQRAFWDPIKNAERDINLKVLESVFDRLDTLPGDAGLAIAEVFGRLVSVVEDCKVLVQLRSRPIFYTDFARVRGARAFKEVRAIKLLLATSMSALEKYRGST